jgi:hypothetical protein
MDMEPDYSRDALMKFFGYLSSKGLVNANTVAAKKAAANKMLSVLDAAEASDLRKIDLERVSTQFFHLHGQGFTPDSMNTYKSRLKSGIDDFLKYTANPASFKPDAPRPRSQNRSENDPKSGNGNSNGEIRNPPVSPPMPEKPDENIFPIPIRSGLVVKLVGLPADLTKKEAQKISNVVLAFASIED